MRSVALLLLLLCCALHGQVSYDTSAAAHSSSIASTLDIPLTTGTLTHGMLVVGLMWYQTIPQSTITSVTFNTTTTCSQKILTNNGVNQPTTAIYYCLNPPSATTANVSIVWSSNGSGHNYYGAVISLSGAAQSAPEASAGSVVTGTHTAHSDSITTVTNNAWIIDVQGYVTDTPSFTVNGSQNLRIQRTAGSDTSIAMSTLGPVSPAAATSVGWGFASTGSATSHSAVSVAPFAAVTSTARHRKSIL